MKIAEALIERSDIQNRISQLEIRLNNNSKTQGDEKPSEDPVKLIAELDSLTERLEQLVTRINLTNSTVKVGEVTLTELLSHRDCLTKKAEIMRRFLSNASQTIIRGAKTEIVIKPTVSVEDLQKSVDELSREIRETDIKIQGTNWSTDII